MLGYLQKSTRPEILMALHQYAWFNELPKISHETTIKQIA